MRIHKHARQGHVPGPQSNAKCPPETYAFLNNVKSTDKRHARPPARELPTFTQGAQETPGGWRGRVFLGRQLPHTDLGHRVSEAPGGASREGGRRVEACLCVGGTDKLIWKSTWKCMMPKAARARLTQSGDLHQSPHGGAPRAVAGSVGTGWLQGQKNKEGSRNRPLNSLFFDSARRRGHDDAAGREPPFP